MPDAARLVAAISLAIAAFLLSGLVMEIYEREVAETNFGYFVWVNVVIGAFVGWTSMGKRAGRGISAAITNGITGVFLFILYGLFVQAANEMTRLAMKNRFDTALDAIAAIFQIMAEWGLMLLDAPLLITAAVSAFVCGILTEYAWRTWR